MNVPIKVALFVLCFGIWGGNHSFAQQFPNSSYTNLDFETNPAFSGMTFSNPDLFGAYTSVSNGKNTFVENDYAIKAKIYLRDLFKPIHRDDIFLEPEDEDYLNAIGLGYVYRQTQVNVDLPRNNPYSAHYLSLSYAHLIGHGMFAYGVGLQPGFINNPENQNQFNVNAGFSFFGAVLDRQKNLWGDCELLKSLTYNYFSVALYNAYSPYYSKNEFDTLSAIPGKRVQFTFQQTFFATHDFHLTASGLVMYNGMVSYMAGPSIVFDVHHKYYDMVRFGIQYKSTGHLVYSTGLRLYGTPDKTISFILNGSYDAPLSTAQNTYGKGWAVTLSVLPLIKCWHISCKANKKGPDLAMKE